MPPVAGQGFPTGPVQGVPPVAGQGFPTGPVQGVPPVPGQGFPTGPTQGFQSGPTQAFPSGPVEGFPSGPVQGVPPVEGQGFPPGPTQGFPAGAAEGFPSGPVQAWPVPPAQGWPAGAPGVPGGPPGRPVPRRAPFWQRPVLMSLLVVTIVLLAAVLIWAPWVAPAPPTELHGKSQTATSVLLQWGKSNGHTNPGKYSVRRDGATVASVSSDKTSFLDDGLRPGQTYTYSVVAESWARHSTPAPDTKVRVLAPSTGKPTTGPVTTSSVTVRWTPPANSPAPDRYEVLRDGDVIHAVENTTMVYKDTGLGPATAYGYQVVAKWGENRSDPSPTLTLRTATPSLSAARLTGSSLPVKSTVTNVVGITNLNKGLTWTNNWDLTARCATGPCDVQVAGDITPPNFKPGTFNVRLTRRGAVYTGATTARLTKCGDIDVTDTVTFRIVVKSAGTEGKEWLAKTWTGTIRVDSPFTNAGGGFFCPGSLIDVNLAG